MDSGACSPGAGSRTDRSIAGDDVDLKDESEVERERAKILVAWPSDEAGEVIASEDDEGSAGEICKHRQGSNAKIVEYFGSPAGEDAGVGGRSTPEEA